MNLKKSIFSYIVWAAFAFLCGFCIFGVLESAGIREMLGIPLIAMIGGVCVYLLFVAAVFFALRTINTEIRRHISNPEKAEAVLSAVLPVMVLIGVVAYLVFYLAGHTPLMLAEDGFYSQALVSEGNRVSFAVHGASWIYIYLLHSILLIFGNTPFAGVVLQIVLFFVCLLLLYIGMQAFVGTIPAAFSMAAFGFLPASFLHIFSLTPELLYLAFYYLLGFALLGLFYRKFRERKILSSAHHAEQKGGLKNVLPVVFIFLLGLYIGFLVYLDIYGISLYLFLTVLFSLDKDRIKQAIGLNLTAVLGGICGFFLSVTVVCLAEKKDVFAYLRELFSLYTSNVEFEPRLSLLMPFQPDVTLGGSIFLISFAFCMIPAFFVWKRSQGSAFILHLFFVYGLSGLSVFHLNAQMMTTFAWSILAGLGVYGIVRPADALDREESAKDSDGAQKKTGKKKDGESRKMKVELQEKAVPESIEAEEKEIPERSQNRLQTDENKRTSTEAGEKKKQEKPAPGEPLPNPLPVPKKKSRPQADFDYQVSEEKMKFDLDVAGDDDFDR